MIRLQIESMNLRFKKPTFTLEVPKEEHDNYYSNDGLTNHDLIPIPQARRTWTAYGFLSYWVVEGVSVSGYTTVSSLVGYGLSVRQSIACAVAAGIIYGCMAVVMGWIGSHHHIGFPVFARACFGIYGAYFGIIIRSLTGLIWCGVQSYYGGQAVATAIAAMSPSFAQWNTFLLTPVGNISSSDFVGFVIFICILCASITIKPERMQTFFLVTFGMVFMAIVGMLIYAMKENGGPGTLLTGSSSLKTRSEVAWACVQGIFSVVGTTGTGILGQSDWTRYSKHKNSPVAAQLIGAPIAVTFAGTMGALITSAAYDMMGEAIWNPIVFLQHVQAYENNSPRARAGVFFAAIAFVGQQLAINLLLNVVSSGMDMAGLAPKYLNIQRAGILLILVSTACCPWFLQANATVVVIFGSGWGAFCSSLTGIVITKYYFIYKRKVLLSDLYKADKTSMYWFDKGFDWRSFVAWALGTAFLMPGLAAQANGKHWGFWNWIFSVSYLWGIVISSLSVFVLHFIFPKHDIPVDSSKDETYTGYGDLIEEDGTSEEEVIDSLKDGNQIYTVIKEM